MKYSDFLFLTFMVFIMIALSNTGCENILKPEMKCSDGVLYIKDNGAWIQALAYKNNKCLPGAEK